MLENPIRLLVANAAFQVLAASLLGVVMLIPMQPWAKALKMKLDFKSMLSTHLDWLMLAFMQWGAAAVMNLWPETQATWVSWLLVFGGWMNVAPYVFRGFGINAFVLGGGKKQLAAAGLSGLSSLSLIIAWSRLVFKIVTS